MTSPKISAENKATPAATAAVTATEVSNGAVAAGTSAQVATATGDATPNDGPAGLFSWLKIFRFANLMIKQGC
uniref:Uncharacterized protein n=1 Tax=Culex tarsalis TaxID=7177 RepID=A0A1Q3G4Z9_CULTA